MNTLFLTQDGDCYCCGHRRALPIFAANQYSKKSVTVYEPTKIQLSNVTHICAGSKSAYFIIGMFNTYIYCLTRPDNQELWMCGEIVHFLVQKKTFKRTEVKPLVNLEYGNSILMTHNKLIKFSDYKVTAISAGYYHMIMTMCKLKIMFYLHLSDNKRSILYC
jgi:alpha-tubulin suppressor-like RCC1 family protein